MISYVMKTIKGEKSGFMEIRIYPNNGNRAARAKKSKKTVRSMIAVNKRNAFELCYLEAIETFTPDDYCLTISFPQNMSDDERLKLFKNMIKRLQRLYKAHGQALQYMYFVGRGASDGMIHFHMLLKCIDSITWESICKKAYKKDKVNAHLEKIRQYHNAGDEMRRCILYLFKHHESLNDIDLQTYGKYWYPSHGLNRYDVFVDDTSGTEHLSKLRRAYNKGTLESYICRANPEYHIIQYGYYNMERYTPFYYDDYGRCYCKLYFARKGSMLDTGHYIYHTHGHAIDSITGEVLY
jgi:hypothetical protein